MEVIKLKRNLLSITLATTLFSSCFYLMPEAKAEGFIDDSSLKAGVYYWYRDRVRKTVTDQGELTGYKANLHNSTLNANLDFSSGYAGGMFGLDLGLYGAIEFTDAGPAYPNEIGFSNAKTLWDERGNGDRSGMNVYKAAVKFQSGPFWARAGYIQPTGQTLLASNWSFLPGAYQGAEVGGIFDYGDSGALSVSYMWANKYKAPWYRDMYEFRKQDGKSSVSYQHSLGAKYDFKNNLVLEAAYGEAHDYMNQYFAKASYRMPVAGQDLAMSYQFYAANDEHDDGTANDAYDGVAWLQALTFAYTTGPVDWRLEGTWVRAEGRLGNFLHRMTTNSNSASNGRLDIWWDSRSDFNANGEKAVYLGAMYDMSHLNARLAGFKVGTSYAYGWDAKPNSLPTFDQNARVRESAWNLDALYTVQSGPIKDTLFKIHFTKYNNHSNNPSWGNGFNNMFQDEKDIKIIMIAPFTIF